MRDNTQDPQVVNQGMRFNDKEYSISAILPLVKSPAVRINVGLDFLRRLFYV